MLNPNKMCQYLIKLKNHEINPPAYKGSFNVEKILNLKQGEHIYDSLLGELSVDSATEHELKLKTKEELSYYLINSVQLNLISKSNFLTHL